jgi:hypothetical protein
MRHARQCACQGVNPLAWCRNATPPCRESLRRAVTAEKYLNKPGNNKSVLRVSVVSIVSDWTVKVRFEMSEASKAPGAIRPRISGSAADGSAKIRIAPRTKFDLSGSPVRPAGTLAFAKVNQTPSPINAGPTSGGAAAPAFHGMVAVDSSAAIGPSQAACNQQALKGGASHRRIFRYCQCRAASGGDGQRTGCLATHRRLGVSCLLDESRETAGQPVAGAAPAQARNLPGTRRIQRQSLKRAARVSGPAPPSQDGTLGRISGTADHAAVLTSADCAAMFGRSLHDSNPQFVIVHEIRGLIRERDEARPALAQPGSAVS